MTTNETFFNEMQQLLDEDVKILRVKNTEYGDSWRKRGGVGAFMMLARKWDRLEEQAKQHGWDVFDALARDMRLEGILDDIGDLRRYLALVETHFHTVIRPLISNSNRGAHTEDTGADPDRRYVAQGEQLDLFAPQQMDLFHGSTNSTKQ